MGVFSVFHETIRWRGTRKLAGAIDREPVPEHAAWTDARSTHLQTKPHASFASWKINFAIAVAYFLAGKFGLVFASLQPNASALWPPAGIALGLCLLYGYGIWPAVFAGAFLVNVTTAGSVATSVGIAAGNTLEALAGAYLVNRFAHGRKAFERPQDIFKFMALAAALCTTLSPTIGLTTLALGGYAHWANYPRVWFTWWLGDAAGEIIFAPLLVLWANSNIRWDRRRTGEAALLFISLAATAGVIYGGYLPSEIQRHPLDLLIIPVLLWVVFRFGPAETAAANFLVSSIAIAGTSHGFGPYAGSDFNSSLLMVQAWVCMMSLALPLAAGLTQRRIAEEGREQLAAIVDSSEDAIYSKTLDGLITSWNPGAERMFGWTADEAVGRSVAIILTKDGLPEERGLLERLARGERVEDFETVRVGRDGSPIDISLTLSPVRDAQGQLAGASVIARDISERKRIEKERSQLAAAQQRAQQALRIVMDSMSAPVTLCNRDLRFVWVNQAYADWLGRSVEEIVGRPIVEVIGQEALRLIQPYIERVLSGESVQYEQRIPYRGGGLRWVQASYTPGPNLHAQADSWVAVVFDVDERRRTEDALKTSIANAEAAQHEALAGARARDEFLAMLSHELRNPLGAIQNALSVCKLAAPAQMQDTNRALDVMSRQVSHMTQLVDDLLETSRVIAGKINLVRQPLDLGACIENIFASALENSNRYQDRRVVISCEPVWISGDTMRIEQVVANLLFNAIKFTPPDGTVEVRVAAQGEFAILEVSDNGAGIEPEMLGRIFDLFVQGDTPLDRSKSGLGVGLTLVRKVVELHGGTVSATSPGKGRGSSFTVRLPRIDAPAQAPRADAPAQTKKSALRVLVIEDNDDTREMLGILLRAEGHEVFEAGDGPSAIRAVRDFQPDAAIVDVGLPGMNGYEVARQIRAMDGKRIRLVAVTGYGGPEDRHRSRQAGFDLHITKPVDPSKLIDLIGSAPFREAG